VTLRTLIDLLEPTESHILAFKIGLGLGVTAGVSVGVGVGIAIARDISSQPRLDALEIIEGTAVDIS
jgi:hypothetical protein